MKTHLQIPFSEKNRNVVVCGSPERAAWFASQLDEASPIAKNREYHSFLGKFLGKDILITSHGVGSAGAAICFQELIDAGAKTIIRVGTAGGLGGKTGIGDIVVPTAAVRKDGVSCLMVPTEYPAVPSLGVTQDLISQLELSSKVSSGIILSTDLFYPGKLPTSLEFYQSAGVIAVEMECATLFVTASLRGVKSAACLVLDGTPLQKHGDSYDPTPERLAASMAKCFEGALRALTGEGKRRQ